MTERETEKLQEIVEKAIDDNPEFFDELAD